MYRPRTPSSDREELVNENQSGMRSSMNMSQSPGKYGSPSPSPGRSPNRKDGHDSTGAWGSRSFAGGSDVNKTVEEKSPSPFKSPGAMGLNVVSHYNFDNLAAPTSINLQKLNAMSKVNPGSPDKKDVEKGSKTSRGPRTDKSGRSDKDKKEDKYEEMTTEEL